MNAEAFHEPERARYRSVGHDPHNHVHAFGRQGDKILERIVGRLRLRKVSIRLGFYRMNNVREFDRILDEEY